MPARRSITIRKPSVVGPPPTPARAAKSEEDQAPRRRSQTNSPDALRALAEEVVALYNRSDTTSIGNVASELKVTRARIAKALASVGLNTPGKGRRAAGFKLVIPTGEELEAQRAQERIIEVSPELLAEAGVPVTLSVTLSQIVSVNRAAVIDLLVAGMDERVQAAVRALLY